MAEYISELDAITLGFIYLFLIIIGACLGSFASAIIPREMSGESWFALKGESARSRCPPCGKTLTAIELIPIISFLLQKQKCACGKFPLPIIYPILEIVSLCLTIFIIAANGISIESLGLIISIPFLLTACHLNFNAHIISDRILMVLAYIAVGTSLIVFPNIDLMAAMAGAGLIGVISSGVKLLFDKFSAHELFGWDNVKLWIIWGFWLGAGKIGLFIFLIGLGGVLWAVTPVRLKKIIKNFPYCYWSVLSFYILYFFA